MSLSLSTVLGKSVATFFKGGVHPAEFKELTCQTPIEQLAAPKQVQLHLQQHIGEAANPVVKKGDVVLRGQLVASAVGSGVPVHASIAGKVANIGRAPHPNSVEGQAIVIEAGENPFQEVEFPEDTAWRELPAADMLSRIREAGIVGLGGAAFPTYRKLTLPAGHKVDTLIINGAECEPYLTSDHRMMLEYPEQMLLGAWLMARVIGVNRCLIGIEDNKQDAAELLERKIGELHSSLAPVKFEVRVARTRYPQGSEKQLIQALTGRNVPARKLPMDVGVVVQNVATAVACHEAIRYKRPLLDRIVTMSGMGLNQPKNLRVPLGTGLATLVAACGGMKDTVVKIVAGGPMMGRTVPTIEIPLIKGNGGFLFLTKAETYLGDFQACVMCARCLEACPLGLEPNRISILVEAGHPLDTAEHGTHECFECGCCSYACPSKRPLVQFIQVAKTAYRRDQRLKEAAHGK
ncbi:MAG: electron transport complex subunit RsxC [Oligoflexia bacterium]|nr:electron transport complex subunit RsxC [Oligoflexia bacterium]